MEGYYRIWKGKELLDEGHNLVVASQKILSAALFKGDPTLIDGIQYMAWGEGDPNWDSLGTPDPDYTDSTLVNEIAGSRKLPTQIVYLDDLGNISGTPTHILQVTAHLGTGDLDPAGIYIREYGLFGGNATLTKDSGLMIDVIRPSSRIWKDSSISLDFEIRLEF